MFVRVRVAGCVRESYSNEKECTKEHKAYNELLHHFLFQPLSFRFSLNYLLDDDLLSPHPPAAAAATFKTSPSPSPPSPVPVSFSWCILSACTIFL